MTSHELAVPHMFSDCSFVCNFLFPTIATFHPTYLPSNYLPLPLISIYDTKVRMAEWKERNIFFRLSESQEKLKHKILIKSTKKQENDKKELYKKSFIQKRIKKTFLYTQPLIYDFIPSFFLDFSSLIGNKHKGKPLKNALC